MADRSYQFSVFLDNDDETEIIIRANVMGRDSFATYTDPAEYREVELESVYMPGGHGSVVKGDAEVRSYLTELAGCNSSILDDAEDCALIEDDESGEDYRW